MGGERVKAEGRREEKEERKLSEERRWIDHVKGEMIRNEKERDKRETET